MITSKEAIIETLIPVTTASDCAFDGITYAKVAASLNQLHSFVGYEAFRDGLRYYFKTYAYKNTERTDFLEAIASFTDKNLSHWARQWFETSGANRIHLEFECHHGKVKKSPFIKKRAHPEISPPHKTLVGFYKVDKNAFKLISKKELFFEKELTSFPELTGMECPDFVFLNQDDHDYGLYSLDAQSMKLAKRAIAYLPDNLSRLMLWSLKKILKQ
jgi:aminopeptidase N